MRFDEENSWHRYHVQARKDFFGDDSKPLPPDGPSHDDLDDVRITHCHFLDSKEEVYRDSRDAYASGHRVRTHKFWTGVTILYDKGCAPKRRRPVSKKGLSPPAPEKGKVDSIDYPQSAPRRERPYTGTGKPNSISADDWRSMSGIARRIYRNTEREIEIKKSKHDDKARDPSAPAVENTCLLIEFACESDSSLSAAMFEGGGNAIRVTKDKFNILRKDDIDRLIKIVRENPKCDLWSSIPCGSWSTWQHVNLSRYGPEFASELNEARRQSQAMFAAFIRVSREIRRGGGRIAFEWPRHCLGWSQPFMKRFLNDPEIATVDIDGCSFGMKDKDGTPIRKQWKIATSSPELVAALAKRTCQHERHFNHARIAGSLTPLTALYPKLMCQTVIKTWYSHRRDTDLTITVAVAKNADLPKWKRNPHALYIHPVRDGLIPPCRLGSGGPGLVVHACDDHVIPAGGKVLIGTGFAVTLPNSVYGRISPHKGGVGRCSLDVSPGVIDPCFDGEIKVLAFNSSCDECLVKSGDQIAQLVIEKVSVLSPEVCIHKIPLSRKGKSADPGPRDANLHLPAASATFPSHTWSSLQENLWFSMPRGSGHNPFLGLPPFSACVARPVPRKEAKVTPKAFAALEKEWKKLRDLGCWDETKVREWREVAAEAKRKEIKLHVGRVFDICVEKNHELEESDPNRKFKGRVVFEGCHVKDESNAWAIFSEASSCPATMAAGKMADAYGLLLGNSLEVSDGESAYTQALLGGTKTWIRLPRDQWPKSWDGMQDPVCPLILALYGHPDAGAFWEQHCETQLKKVGFIPVASWPSVFRHPKLGTFLVVYVDDFKQSGPTANLAEGWRLIGSVIKMEEPRPLKRYLGCEHEFRSAVVEGPFDPRTAWTNSQPPAKGVPELRFGPELRSAALSITSRVSCKHVLTVTLSSACTSFLRLCNLLRPHFLTRASPSSTKIQLILNSITLSVKRRTSKLSPLNPGSSAMKQLKCS